MVTYVVPPSSILGTGWLRLLKYRRIPSERSRYHWIALVTYGRFVDRPQHIIRDFPLGCSHALGGSHMRRHEHTPCLGRMSTIHLPEQDMMSACHSALCTRSVNRADQLKDFPGAGVQVPSEAAYRLEALGIDASVRVQTVPDVE